MVKRTRLGAPSRRWSSPPEAVWAGRRAATFRFAAGRHTTYLLRDLARLVLGDPVTIVPVQTGPPPDAAALRPLAGTYTVNVDSQPLEIRFWVDGKTLMSQAAGQDRIPLRPACPTCRAAFDWSVRYTFNVANGAATSLTFEQSGSTFAGLRKR